jgi:hypothetical protein
VVEELLTIGTSKTLVCAAGSLWPARPPNSESPLATSSPVAILVLPLSNNVMSSTSGRHRAKVTSENDSGLYLSLYDLAGASGTTRKFEIRRIR